MKKLKMANHASAAKAHKQSLVRRARNKSRLRDVKTSIKKAEALIIEKKIEEARVAVRYAESRIMQAVKKHIFKLNTGSRRVSKLTHAFKLMSGETNPAAA